jgi:hypothetical protein
MTNKEQCKMAEMKLYTELRRIVEIFELETCLNITILSIFNEGDEGTKTSNGAIYKRIRMITRRNGDENN